MGIQINGQTDNISAADGSLSIIGVDMTVSAGSTSAPSISPSGDSNTGIFFPSPDTIAFAEGGVEGLRLDSSGRVTMPYQLHIHGSPRNTTGDGIFNAFHTYSSTGLSFSTDRITVPIAGVYLITFTTITESSSIRRDSNIFVNGVTVQNHLSENSTTGFHYRSGSLSIKLQANDYIQFTAQSLYKPSVSDDEWRTASITLLG